MRLTLIAISAAMAITACQPAAPPPPASEPAPPPAPAAAAPAASLFTGAFEASSNAAAAITGDLTIDGATLQFGLGHVYQTEVVGAFGAKDAFSTTDKSTPTDVLAFQDDPTNVLELRKVTSELVNAKAENGGLCTPDATTYLLLSSRKNAAGAADDIQIAAFSGAQAPGPTATASKLCGTLRYTPK
jgi:hypothetical protein